MFKVEITDDNKNYCWCLLHAAERYKLNFGTLLNDGVFPPTIEGLNNYLDIKYAFSPDTYKTRDWITYSNEIHLLLNYIVKDDNTDIIFETNRSKVRKRLSGFNLKVVVSALSILRSEPYIDEIIEFIRMTSYKSIIESTRRWNELNKPNKKYEQK